MRKLTDFILVVALLCLTALNSWSYSLGGPIGNRGDAWQVPSIGYGLAGDLNAPKNIGEEYRRNLPTVYYAYDANFIGYFGSAGITNIDLAFGLMNGVLNGWTNTTLFLTSPTNAVVGTNGLYNGINLSVSPNNNLDNYNYDLSEFPLSAIDYNYTAAALGLVDLKSVMLNALVEQMGLADPVRYSWTLHNRYQPPGTTCPVSTEYIVVQRNFDYINSPLNQIQYSPYINDTLYTYQIFEFCSGTPVAITAPVNVDPFASLNSAVASQSTDIYGFFSFNFLGNFFDYQTVGGYYTGLTRDDVAGLKYLMTSNNINYEATAVNDSFLLTTNVQSPTLLTTLPLSLLFSQALTNDPVTLQTNYPGLTYLSVQTNVVNVITTNLIAYFTNLAGPYTNKVPISNGVAIYPNQGLTVPYTNWAPVQFGDPPQLLTTLPLRPLLFLAQYLDPVSLQALYPGLLVEHVTTNYLAVEISTNVEPYFTNLSVMPVYSNTLTGGLPNVTTLTNIYYFTNQPGPTTINYDRTIPFENISTLDLGTFIDAAKTNDPTTLIALYPGLQILRTNTFPSFQAVTNFVSYLTNQYGAPYQAPPKLVTLATSTNYVWVTNYNYTFGNVFTNHLYTNRFITIQSIYTTNIVGAPWPSFITVSNSVTIKTNLLSGDFFIIPTNWCGFDLVLSFPLGNPPYRYGNTNTVIVSGYTTNGSVGTNYLSTVNSNTVINASTFGLVKNYYNVYTNYNYAVYPGICMPVIQFGTNYTTNIFNKYQYEFLNVVTNHYYTNTLVSLFITNVYAIPGGSPDLLATNITVTSYYTNLPSGDFYIVPTNWCGYQIVSLLTNFIAPTNIVFTNQTFGAGNGPTNIQYSYVQYFTYTNYAYSIRPGICEPALAFATNFSTNIVTQYKYYFGSIVTNRYYTNGTATVVTTNLAIWTNALAGLLTNIITTNTINTGVGGDFFIVPSTWCAYSILATQLNTVTITTNQFNATNLAAADVGQRYTQTTTSSFTNSTFLLQPSTCETTVPLPALRQGIQRMQFIRANYDSLLGQFFTPITNYYTMTRITNSQPVKEFYQRIVTSPDYILSAYDQSPTKPDLLAGPSVIPVNAFFNRNLTFDQSTALTDLAGPGVITGPTTISFNKAGRAYFNISPLYMSQTNAAAQWVWGSFDSSTNAPVVYPNGTSLANLENQVFIQVSPQVVPSGTNGVVYSGITFSVTGGQAPFTWSAPNFSSLVPGLNFNASTRTISGTPVAAGSFNFTIQATDSVNRTVSLNYTITIY